MALLGRMKNKKVQFIRAVRLLAPRNSQILKFAMRVSEEGLPSFPGGAALEFVAAFEKLAACPERKRHFRPSIVPSPYRRGHSKPSNQGPAKPAHQVSMAA
jgi:hypothetical protein